MAEDAQQRTVDAIVADVAGVTFYRFRTGKWKASSRAYRPDAEGA